MNSTAKVLLSAGIFGAIGGVGLLTWRFLDVEDRTIKDIKPDEPAQPPSTPMGPGKTGYRRIDAILDKLRAASRSSGIPLGLMVGWIAKESGGKLADTTSLNERGYFQLMPAESKKVDADHERLSTDSDYSIDKGVELVELYRDDASKLGVAPAGSSYFWKVVKLIHSMGGGQVKKIVAAAKDDGSAGSWEELEDFAKGMSIKGPQPKKWLPFVDQVYAIGKPFGFGTESAAIVGVNGLDFLGAEDWA